MSEYNINHQLNQIYQTDNYLSYIPSSNGSPLSKEKQNRQIYSLVICLDAKQWFHTRSFNQKGKENAQKDKT